MRQGPDSNTVRGAGIGALLLAVATAATPAQAAEESRQVALAYEVHIGGIYGLKAETVLRTAGDRFTVEAFVGKDGVLGALSKTYRAAYGSRGRLVDGRIVPGGSVGQVTSGDKARALRASYAADGTLIMAENPPYEPKPGREVPADKTRGAWDPLMAAMVAVVGRRNPCEGKLPIFDGRTRFDLEPRALGHEKIETDGYKVQGQALLCEVRLHRIAGYKPDPGEKEDFDKPARLWLGAIDDTGRLYPLRVEIETGFGTVVGQLRKVESRPLTPAEYAAVTK